MMNLFVKLLGSTLLAFAVASAQAQAPAGNSIRLVVGTAPGGALDILGRLLAIEASKVLGAPIHIENKPGNSGIVSALEVARSPGDGRTFLLTTISPLVINVAVFPKLPYDPAKELAPVIAVGRFPLALYVPAASKYRNVADLIADAKARPSAVNIGTLGAANLSNLAAERLAELQGFKFTAVPYNGEANMMLALASGQVDAAITTLGGAMALLQGGRVRAIATLDNARFAAIPDVPTMAEQGIRNMEASGTPCIVAPSRTPPEVIDRMNKAINFALKQPEVARRMRELLMVQEGGLPEDLTRMIAADGERWIPLIKRLGIREE